MGAARMFAWTPKTIRGYRLGERAAYAREGICFRAVANLDGSAVVIQSFPELAGVTEVLPALRSHADRLNHLPQGCVPRVHDVGETEDGIPYLVTGVSDGRTLREILSERGRRVPAPLQISLAI